MRYRAIVLVLLTTWILTACNLGREDNDDNEPTDTVATIDPGGQPEVTILSPEEGDEFVVDEPILISINATDTVGVTSVQLLANGTVARSVASESATGDTQREFLLDYTPRNEGELTLEVVALRGGVESAPATVNVVVRSTQSQVVATPQPGNNVPIINPNDPTCRGLVNTRLNFRRGPDTSFDVIRILDTGELLPVVGRLADNSWWQLSSGANIGWVARDFITLYGVCSSVAVISIPTPTSNVPTSTPTATSTNTSIPPTSTSIPTDAPTPTPATPNVQVTNIAGATQVVIPADADSVTIQYSVAITNRGGVINQQFSTSGRLLPSLPNEGQFDVGVVGRLDANQSINLNFTVTFDTPGSYILQVTADNDNEIAEDNESDNSGTLNVTVIREEA